MRKLRHSALLGSAALLASAPVMAQTDEASKASPATDFFTGWSFNGTNTARYDQYGEKGPDGPYPDEGAKVYDEVDVNFSKRDGAYRRWRGQIALLLNDNEYRAQDKGIVPERINLTREAGDQSLGNRNVPYRWEVGDYFSYFSYMTQQLSGKGAQAEMQPGLLGDADSFVMFGGTNETRWQELEFDVDNSVGSSYLVRFDDYGEVSLNSVYNFRKGDESFGTEDQDQVVISSTYAHEFVFMEQELAFQVEQALFGGDHAGIPGTAKASNRFGVGTFAEMRGRHPELPLDYRVRGERYDEDFRPRGGAVSADRQSGEAHIGWRFASGLRARARFQGYEDNFQQDNERRTTLGGINLSGPMFTSVISELTGTVDLLAQQVKNDDKTFDTASFNFRADFGRAITEGWYGRVGFFGDIANDRTDTDADLDTWQITLSANHDFQLGPFKGLLTPGMVFRFLRASNRPGDSDEYNPTLALQLEKANHSFGFNYGTLAQNRSDPMTVDINRHTLSADYKFDLGPNSFGAEVSYFGLRPDDREDTDAWQAGIYWTFKFDHAPAAPPRMPGAEIPSPFAAEPTAIQSVDVWQLAPGLAYIPTRDQLAALGVTGGEHFGDYDVFEVQLFQTVAERQRLVLVRERKTITKSAVVIDFDSTFTGDTARQTFERVRKTLIDRYGMPTRLFEQGEFGAAFVADVNAQRLLRISEWDTPTGVVRFGIPRRLDGTVRMEVQHGIRFGPSRDTLWSIEAVR